MKDPETKTPRVAKVSSSVAFTLPTGERLGRERTSIFKGHLSD